MVPNQIQRNSIVKICFFIVFTLFGRVLNGQNNYLICIYNEIPYEHWNHGSTKGFIEDDMYIIDTVNLEKFKLYCKTIQFNRFYLLHHCIDPDSVRSIPLYLATIPYIRDSVLKISKKISYDSSNRTIPYIIELDSNKAKYTTRVVNVFSIAYSDNVLFKDANCFDYNEDRKSMRRRSNVIINCPEFYLHLADLKPKLIDTFFLKNY